MITVKNLSCTLGNKKILHSVSCNFSEGHVTGILGPNGSGKSTLLRCITREIPSSGFIFFDDRPLESFTQREMALNISVLAQEGMTGAADFLVEDMIVMGRYAHKGFGQAYDADDRKFTAEALNEVGLNGFGSRHFLSLSGGEKQRVLLARALCQNSPVLILDEPTNHLDTRHQIQLVSLLRKHGRTVIVVLHDVNLAALACDSLLFLKDGTVNSSGTPEETITESLMLELYGVKSVVTIEDGSPHVRLLRQ